MSKEKDIQICSYDVFYNKTHKLSSIYKYFQQIAREDLDDVGLTYETLLSSGMVFVLAKMKSVFYKPIFSSDEIKLESSHRKVKGVSFIRDYILTKGGEIVGETSSYWVLMDINSRRLCRPNVLESSLNSPKELCSFEIEDRFSFPDNVQSSKYTYTVVFSDIDENNHMNNTRYPDVCLDAVEGISADSFVSGLRIDYISEAKLGEELFIEYTNVDNTYYFAAQNRTTGKKCFDAEIIVDKF